MASHRRGARCYWGQTPGLWASLQMAPGSCAGPEGWKLPPDKANGHLFELGNGQVSVKGGAPLQVSDPKGNFNKNHVCHQRCLSPSGSHTALKSLQFLPHGPTSFPGILLTNSPRKTMA